MALPPQKRQEQAQMCKVQAATMLAVLMRHSHHDPAGLRLVAPTWKGWLYNMYVTHSEVGLGEVGLGDEWLVT